MCRTYVEDFIDFRCSDTYRDHYFEAGQTPFHSPRYRGCRDRLASKQIDLDDKLAGLAEAVEHLVEVYGLSPAPVVRKPPTLKPPQKFLGGMPKWE